MSSRIGSQHSQELLKHAVKELEAIYKKYSCGGLVTLGNKEGGEFCIFFPDWSVIQQEGDKLRIKIKKEDVDSAESTLDFLLTSKEICSNYVLSIDNLIDEIVKKTKLEIDRNVITPEDMGIKRNIQ